MLRSLMGFDWKKSKAHWLLLSKFIHPQNPEDFAKADYWKDVLGENPAQSIERFLDQGLIRSSDLNNTLAYRFKTTELKAMLKQYGLPGSGRKDEMIERLTARDPINVSKTVAGLSILECTQQGKNLAEEYLLNEKNERDRVEGQVLEYIRRRMFREASVAVAVYEAKQVFARGIGIDWNRHSPDRDIGKMNIIFNSKPKILSKLGDDKLDNLREGAAMMALWGKNSAHEWLPADFETGSSFDVDTAARMFLFYANHKVSVQQYRDSGVVKYVEILVAQDSCDACKKHSKKKYRLDQVPELPYEQCTHEKGCRCTMITVVGI